MTSNQQMYSMNDNKDNKSVDWFDTIRQLNFEHRKCKAFIAQEINREKCVCGNPHHKNDGTQSNETWNWEKHTERIPTKCYGILPHSESPYLRCEIETKLSQVCLILLEVWNIPVPNLVMRMIGDATSTLSVKLEKEVLQGISDAAVASDAWIITSGYKEETISELIGEIVYKNRVKNAGLNFSAIAVGKWGNIRDRCILGGRCPQDLEHHLPGRYALEPNHTHYIFFDDGTYNSTDTAEFASRLARQISYGAMRRVPLVTILVGGNLYALRSIWIDLINQVSVVIINQSGPLANIFCKYFNATKNISKTKRDQTYEDVDHDDENDIDMFMLDYSFELPKFEDLKSSDKFTLREVLRPFGKLRLAIYNDLSKLYTIMRREEYKTVGRRFPVGELLTLTEKRNLASFIFYFATCLTSWLRNNIRIFDFNLSNSLQNTIYVAMVQAKKNLSRETETADMTNDDQARLALRWSIPNITEDHLLTSTMDWNDSNKIEQNRSLLLDGLSKNLQVFVRNFIQLDTDLSVLLGHTANSWRREEHWSPENYYLKELYSETKRNNPDQLYLLNEIDQKLDFKKEIDLNKILKILVGDFIYPLYGQSLKASSISKKSRGKRKIGTANRDIENGYELNDRSFQQTSNSINESTKKDVELIYRDIFLWCILTYRLAMAKIILSQMKTRICSALIASKILKSLTYYAPDHESKEKLYSEANIFETYAIEFVRCSYIYNKQQTCELIIRQLNIYGNVTCLQMAIAGDNKRFLNEDACQALLTNIWYDKIDPVQERTRLVINLLTMGISQLFISMYEKYLHQDQSIKQKMSKMISNQSTSRLEKYGIDYSDDYGMNEPIIRHFFHFHNRPIVKYVYTCFGYFIFLLIFSYYMLYAFDPLSNDSMNIHWTEILTIIIVTSMLFEEIRQFCFQENPHLKDKILTYFDWNNRSSKLCLLLPAYLLFYVGLVLRFVMKNVNNFSAARIVMAYDLELWFIIAVLFVSIASDLGPKLVMIRKMTNDLLLFIFIIVVFIFGYGITSRSMTAYGTIDFNGQQFFRNIVYPVYYFVLGNFENELSQLDETPDASTTIATQVMFAFHMLFVNILLLNLLVALFSNTINDVETQAHYIWAYDRCTLIRDYYTRPALFPPFTFFVSVAEFCQWCWRKCKHDQRKVQCFKMIPAIPYLDSAWSNFERFSTNDYIRQLVDSQANAASNIIMTDIPSDLLPTSTDESKWLKSDINQMKDELTRLHTDTSDKSLTMESTISSLQERIEQIDNRFDKMITEMISFQDSLNWMMKAMARANMDKDPPLILQKPRTSISNQEYLELSVNVLRNRQTSTSILPFQQSQKSKQGFGANDIYMDPLQELSKQEDV